MKAQRLPSDIISTLPLTIIETILCLMPIQDAVRTCILSRKWRYNWLKIPKLVFDEEEMVKKSIDENAEFSMLSEMEQRFEVPSERIKMPKRCRFFYAIYQVLLLHHGPIHDFTLKMTADETCVEIDHIILHLLRNNTIKKFTLDSSFCDNYKLPLSFFSLHQLTDLYLINCTLDPQSRFNGFNSLTSLYFNSVFTTKKTLLRLISNTPLLKSLTLIVSKDLFLSDGHSTIIELFECLPVIEHLDMWLCVIKCFAGDGIPREIPTSLVHLKYLCLDEMCFIDEYGLPFVALFIRSSPKLEKIKLQIVNDSHLQKCENDSVKLEDYSDIWLDHLNELEIEDFSNYIPELEFVKLILVKSPMLKKVRIVLHGEVAKDEELQLLRSLLVSSRASPVVKIIVERPPDTCLVNAIGI